MLPPSTLTRSIHLKHKLKKGGSKKSKSRKSKRHVSKSRSKRSARR